MLLDHLVRSEGQSLAVLTGSCEVDHRQDNFFGFKREGVADDLNHFVLLAAVMNSDDNTLIVASGRRRRRSDQALTAANRLMVSG